ncbi:uncharacterized protein LOC120569496 [Perca fluviatilis]|uniref:uncharacterized protein LOC120569496 n=1 Tax=Perca fluviatilis TaxID=8168 RepID=UPI001963054E|nr:uncharacterized protein LOC120569496 [Perca fluviatilis]
MDRDGQEIEERRMERGGDGQERGYGWTGDMEKDGDKDGQEIWIEVDRRYRKGGRGGRGGNSSVIPPREDRWRVLVAVCVAERERNPVTAPRGRRHTAAQRPGSVPTCSRKQRSFPGHRSAIAPGTHTGTHRGKTRGQTGLNLWNTPGDTRREHPHLFEYFREGCTRCSSTFSFSSARGHTDCSVVDLLCAWPSGARGGVHADRSDASMKQDIMAEGPRCKRRKQANPRRKHGKTARTQTHKQTHTVPQTLLSPPGWLSPPGRDLPAGPGTRQKRHFKVL